MPLWQVPQIGADIDVTFIARQIILYAFNIINLIERQHGQIFTQDFLDLPITLNAGCTIKSSVPFLKQSVNNRIGVLEHILPPSTFRRGGR